MTKSLFLINENYQNGYIDSARVYGQRPCYWQVSEIMVIKTLSDCTQCPHMTECDAHISGGTHKHQKGPDPCEMILNPENKDINL